MRKLGAVVIVLVCSSLQAQTVTVGQIMPYGGTTVGQSAAPVSFVDLAHPATAGGTLTTATVLWSRTCSGAFRVVFLRSGGTIGTFALIAQRGPFDAVSGTNRVTLSPPVVVNQGDLIGIVQLQPLVTCGSVRHATFPDGLGSVLLSNNDISTGSIAGSSGILAGDVMGAMASGTDNVLVRVLPAAGATQGSTAFFRTAVQVMNLTSNTITGKLVFHPAGQSGSDSDPSIPFTLNSFQVVSYPDVVTSIGTSGLGSLDVITAGGVSPMVTARVFSDGGSAGTSGFTEDGLAPSEALRFFEVGTIFLPTDLTNFRVNVGVRTLESGATITVSWYNKSGAILGTAITLTYPPNYFEQKSLSQFLNGATNFVPDGYILAQITSGSAFVYATVTDNRTSDSAMRLAKSQ